jgi:hypothetical protein
MGQLNQLEARKVAIEYWTSSRVISSQPGLQAPKSSARRRVNTCHTIYANKFQDTLEVNDVIAVGTGL